MFALINVISRASIRLKGSYPSCFRSLPRPAPSATQLPSTVWVSLHGSVFPLVTLKTTVGKWEVLKPIDLLGFCSCLLFHVIFFIFLKWLIGGSNVYTFSVVLPNLRLLFCSSLRGSTVPTVTKARNLWVIVAPTPHAWSTIKPYGADS